MPKPPFPHHTDTHQHSPYLPHSVIIVPTLKYTFLQCIFEFSVKKQRIRPAKDLIANAILHHGTPLSEIF